MSSSDTAHASQWALLVVLAASLLPSSCVSSSSAKSQAQPPEPSVSFLEPTEAGYRVFGLDGKPRELLTIGENKWVSGFTPDLSGYYTKTFQGSSIVLAITSKTWGKEEIYRGPWSADRPESTPRLLWGAADGSQVAVLVDGKVTVWARCAKPRWETIVDDGVRAFAASSKRMFLVRKANPRKLEWRDWDGPANGALELPFETDLLWIGRSPYEVITGRSTEGGSISDLALADTLHGGPATAVQVPVQGRVLDLGVIEGTTESVARVWDGKRERIDGTEIGTFFLWNYETGKADRIFDDPGGYQIHSHVRDGFDVRGRSRSCE